MLDYDLFYYVAVLCYKGKYYPVIERNSESWKKLRAEKGPAVGIPDNEGRTIVAEFFDVPGKFLCSTSLANLVDSLNKDSSLNPQKELEKEINNLIEYFKSQCLKSSP